MAPAQASQAEPRALFDKLQLDIAYQPGENAIDVALTLYDRGGNAGVPALAGKGFQALGSKSGRCCCSRRLEPEPYGVATVQRRSGARLMPRSSVTSATSRSSARAT